VGSKTLAPEISLGKRMALEHGTHCPVKDKDAP
jgi:hypothetical protein